MPSDKPDRSHLDRASVLVFATVMVTGALLLQMAHRYLDLGPTPGNMLFVPLPIVAVLAAAGPPVLGRRVRQTFAAVGPQDCA